MNNDENALYWIWLSERFGVASREFPRFADKLDDPYDIYRLEAEELEQTEGISDSLKERLSDKSLDGAYKILKYCKKNKISVIGYGDGRYPSRLRNIENPPVLLYCLGKLPSMDKQLCIGMVGTRKMSEYGKQTAYKISYELAAANVCIVSGMALGVDGVCAVGAIEAGGVTVAVLGCGLSMVYPKEHERLMRSIASNGAVITEYPPFERPLAGNFPKRNRIISGLCQGVVIVEGAKGSGALITAQRAIAQGRELFALPGKIDDSNSDGPNELIRSGANVVLCADDIIKHYDFLYHDVIAYGGLARAVRHSECSDGILKRYGVSPFGRGKRSADTDEAARHDAAEMPAKPPLSKLTSDGSATVLASLDEATVRVFELLPDGTSFAPDTVAAHGIDVGDVITALTMLEICGLVSSLPGGLYVKR